ncbi:hypothetical protein [Aquimarina brevivitae]|uniref:Uncharacterized protein n=1 Tax=Aquimarina brevivitae TaxID=323412 RepID=A0A4Q7P3X1_9FLAO|nr:hypothetical protein [Aquimarina brevivitae]RZS93382.1 hypothetical protein EV197_1960 [Aquimarina brevivitae]
MHNLPHRINLFFKKDFRRRFILAIIVPLVLSIVYLVDFYALSGHTIITTISYSTPITVSQNVSGTSARKPRTIGHRYYTTSGHQFTITDYNLKSEKISLTISPLYKSVKMVISEGKTTRIASGLSGVSGFLFVICNVVMLVSLGYIYLVKTISDNARLNIIYLHVFLFFVWGYILFLF